MMLDEMPPTLCARREVLEDRLEYTIWPEESEVAKIIVRLPLEPDVPSKTLIVSVLDAAFSAALMFEFAVFDLIDGEDQR